ncbi:MAG: transcription-repair coupling factor [Spirochaetae bacterium HGW-Spirochaetae-7]|nr:MAG: transcription-repair coupling factor [Spirochaetae bacterium HGW-Spirochaetae-7]
MNSLRLENVSKRLLRHEPVAEAIKRLESGPFPVDCAELEAPFAAFIVAAASRRAGRKRFLVVVPTDAEADAFASDCEAAGVPSMVFPWWKTAAYRPVEPRSPAFGQRAAALAALLDDDGPRVIVAGQRAAMTPVPPRDSFEQGLFRIRKGDAIDATAIADRLASWGYLRVPRVSLPGEFALRGEVLDVYMPGDEAAWRFVFEYDVVEELRRFEPVSQASDPERPASALLRPAREFVWTPDIARAVGIELLACPSPSDEDRSAMVAELVEALSERGEAKGEETMYPLAYGRPASIFEYLGHDDVVVLMERERLSGQTEAVKREYAGLYRKAMLDGAVPPPERILVDFDEVAASLPRTMVSWSLKDADAAGRLAFGSEPPRSFFGNVNYFRDELDSLLRAKYEVHVFAENAVQAERIGSLIARDEVAVHPEGLSAGFTVPLAKIAFVHEGEIFGRRRRAPKSLRSARSKVIDTFIELNPGDFVVHVNYGIGRFTGIERVKVMGNDRDYVKIEYAEEESVFVPIEQSNLVQRYIGNEGDEPRLDRLGSKSWEKRKNKVRKSVEDLAERLIRIYSRRKLARGFAFPPDGEWQTSFEAAFPYEETPDQLTCIDDVKRDMESERPMDRLVCGDVGYGKTEIAMRAAFKSVMGGKQVAFLAPTTILAEQHYENCLERFRGLPVTFGMLSRFVDRKDQKTTLAGVAKGSVDVLIGTHRILQKDVAFKDLGLLVVDEEQRFGVKDKERLKEIKANVDCLTLTATPIPRTLHMSMLKIRDLSVLTTPPNNRHPIQTVVDEFQPDLIAKAIRREVERDGQVFFLHNRVQSLDETISFIQRLVPEVMVEKAHGQMDSHELEDIMHRFIHRGFHVLVSTTIIENGIDIPNVNTIIIDRADIYGISQLYQLRGRVGRSDRLAYAYLFYPDGRALSELAMKRLQIISDFTDLGSGFKIAMKDLEVRGAGNLLGREQSGDIFSVGFDLYLKLLDEAVARLSDEGYNPEDEPYLELEYSGFIPDEYISQQAVKMEIYKKIASILGQDDLEALYRELEDRFGPVPEEASSLLALAEIRVLCKKLSIATLKERKGFVTVEFSKVSKISVDRLLRLMKESGQKIKLDPHRPNILMIATGPIGLREKSEFIREKLAALAG